MVRRWRRKSPRLFESLEPRQLLAGNVTAQVVNGDLFIIGDDQANNVEVLGSNIPGVVTVRAGESSVVNLAMNPVQVGPTGELIPLDPDTLLPIAQNPTTINGQGTSVTLDGVLGNVFISTGLRRDTIAVTNLLVRGNLIIDSGAQPDGIVLGQYPVVTQLANGNFQVSPGVGSVGVLGSIQINSVTGDDRITGNRVFVSGDVHVDSGHENDRVEFIDSAARHMSFAMCAGDDRLLFDRNSLAGSLTIVMEGGKNDAIVNNSIVRGAVNYESWEGSDELRLDNTRIDQGLVAVTGEGNDYLEFLRSAIGGTTTVVGCGGDEKLSFEVSRGGTLSVDLGAGSDLFMVKGALLDAFFAQMNVGDDCIDVVGSAISAGSAAGGAGSDATGPVKIPSVFLTEFEGPGLILPDSIKMPGVPNIRFLVQTLTPIPGGQQLLRPGGSINVGAGVRPVLIGGGTLTLTRNSTTTVGVNVLSGGFHNSAGDGSVLSIDNTLTLDGPPRMAIAPGINVIVDESNGSA
jgi:hypothetical protein